MPLIVSDPRMARAKRGQTNDELTLNVDLAPTLLAAAGIKAPSTLQGRDIAPLYLAPRKPAWRTEFFYEHPTITSIHRIPSSEALVRRDWKYILWPDFGTEQLFDLRADPQEENDLATVSAHSARLDALRRRFQERKTAAR